MQETLTGLEQLSGLKKRALTPLLEDAAGSYSPRPTGSQEAMEIQFPDHLAAVERKLNLIDGKIQVLAKHVKAPFWKIDEWEERTFDAEEVDQLLASARRFAQEQQQKEKPKVNLSDFAMPPASIVMGNKIFGSAVAVSCASVGKPLNIGNQDRCSLHTFSNFGCYVVCDGHGLKGADVAAAISDKLPKKLEQEIGQQNPTSKAALFNLVRQVFREMDEELRDFEKSGSTLTCVIQSPLGLMFATIGDSRAVLDIQAKAYQCTADQTTQEPFLVELAKMRGAKVDRLPEEKITGPDRLYPVKIVLTSGMANHAYQTEGIKLLSCIPDITFIPYEEIKEQDCYLILASDGLWRFFTQPRGRGQIPRKAQGDK